MAGKNGVVTFNSLNDVINTYGVPYLDKERLDREGIKHVLIRDTGYLRFGLVMPKPRIFAMMNKDFTDIALERIEGMRGIYGYLGVNTKLIQSIKEVEEIDNKMYIVIAEYEGPFFTVNSGPLAGMIIITENIQNVNFKSITS